ncbi:MULTISPECIES: SDR family NAD(P)-dependent oxidoreductase [unclassified Nocardia]|uniref:SDR family NAD(P)-dependent oxidoreductase n=1 Tax=Nocardia sp. NPDC056541 TaxID=3345860 RepID=UPI003670970C
MNRYTDKIALVTGGTSGMGLATAQRLIDEGAHVVITGRTGERVRAAAAQLGPRATGLAADTADLNAIDTMVAAVTARFGRLDLVFANAGTGAFAAFSDITEADFDHTVDVNLKGVFFTVQKTLPLLTPGAAVVLNASWTLHRADSALTLYAATKAAVHNLARTLATELGPRGIRVNSISPGYIDTPMSAGAMTEEFATMAASRVVSGRFGNTDEIAALVAFLGSAEASYINGQDIIVDGGLVAAYPR